MDNKTLKKDNIEIYGRICMCGYEISRQNPLSMHHILPKSEGGRTTFENSANVTILPHSGLHVLYHDSKQKEKYIMEYLHCFKETHDIQATLEFAKWLKQCMYEMEYTVVKTKGKLLTYKRR